MRKNWRDETFTVSGNESAGTSGGRSRLALARHGTLRRPAPAGSRARLPPLASLRVFEAAARHLSFTKAAEELHVTQAAVSHRIQTLEAELGVTLFHRLTRKLVLTREGRRLAAGVRDGLERIVRAVGELDRHGDAGPLTVSMLPSFASRWLVPRLGAFHRVHPGIEVRVMADAHPVDLVADQTTDLAIRFGRGRYPGLVVTLLAPDSIGPVCSPQLLAQRGRVDSVDALLNLPLLLDSEAEDDDSATGWTSWLAHLGFAGGDPRLEIGPRFSQAHLAIEAAILGHGVAMSRTSLAGDELASGRIVRPLPQTAPAAFRYFLVCRPEVAQWKKVVCFREWLAAEMAHTASDRTGVAV
jgi:LysR family glycine cleavage system transcriptional activator